MTIKSSGSQLAFSEIETEFGANGSRSLGAYRVSQNVGELSLSLDSSIPTSGQIKFSDFYGKSLNVVVGAVDMREAGRPSNNATDRFMFPPQVTTTQRGNLSGVLAGAMIYNTSVNRLQVFNGSTWKDCFT